MSFLTKQKLSNLSVARQPLMLMGSVAASLHVFKKIEFSNKIVNSYEEFFLTAVGGFLCSWVVRQLRAGIC